MKPRELRQLTQRAYYAAKAFRVAAINANAAIETYAPNTGRASRRLRDIAEISTSFALDALVEVAQHHAKK